MIMKIVKLLRRINLPLILDSLFAALCAFLLFFTAVRYYSKSAGIALVFGILAALLFGALAFSHIKSKQRKKLILAVDERDKNRLSLHLALSSEKYVEDLFCKLYNLKIKSQGILENDEAVFFLHFSLRPLSPDDIAEAIKFSTDKNKIILCNKAEEVAQRLASDFFIETRALDGLYLALKDGNLLPEKYIFEGKEKPNFLKRVRARFDKKLAAPLFWSGTGLLFFSYFTFFPIYYIIFGGALMVLAAAARIFGKKTA